MLIVVTSHNFRFGNVAGGTLGRDLIEGWATTPERAVLAGMQTEYVFRGYRTYRLSGEPGSPTYWCEYVLSIDEKDFDLITIALGRVRMFIQDLGWADITSLDTRQHLRMDMRDPEAWESNLSYPPKKPLIFTHNK